MWCEYPVTLRPHQHRNVSPLAICTIVSQFPAIKSLSIVNQFVFTLIKYVYTIIPQIWWGVRVVWFWVSSYCRQFAIKLKGQHTFFYIPEMPMTPKHWLDETTDDDQSAHIQVQVHVAEVHVQPEVVVEQTNEDIDTNKDGSKAQDVDIPEIQVIFYILCLTFLSISINSIIVDRSQETYTR